MTDRRIVDGHLANKVMRDLLLEQENKKTAELGGHKIPKKLDDRLRLLCGQLHCSRSQALREAVERWVNWQENRHKV